MNIHPSAIPGLCQRLGALLLVALAGAACATAGPALEQGASCDSAEPQASLAASDAAASALEARAHWLDRKLIQWPGVQGPGQFRLHHAARGGIHASAGQPVSGADGAIELEVLQSQPPAPLAQRFKYVAPGVMLALREADSARLAELLRGELVLVQTDAQGRVQQATRLQIAGALDDLYAAAAGEAGLGVQVAGRPRHTTFRLWAPTARSVSLCVYPNGSGRSASVVALQRNDGTGVWRADIGHDLSGQYYSYLVDVFVPGMGMVRNRVTDPYSVSLTTNSLRSYVADLDAARLKPSGWDRHSAPQRVKAQTDMVIYELHVRDFSINDASVPAAHRGKYLAFTDSGSRGMQHLSALSRAGLTDVHLLPIFDIATIPEQGCVTPPIPDAAPDSEAQQAAALRGAAGDCFNWGYDPFHFNAPEGSYASDPADGATRIVELRRMVLALHRAGLRVGMDVVYNHTSASGQDVHSVLDRVVPGYYHRLDATGQVEHSTCCANTATENLMMGKLMVDSVALWARHYRMDSFRFDLMGHQPLSVMVELKAKVDRAAGREVQLIGEGWNFGEVANGARFAQAAQGVLNGTGIGTFSDRARDAIRGGSAADSGAALVRNQGYINGLVYDPNALADPNRKAQDLLRAADLVRVGLAGSVRDYVTTDHLGARKALQNFDYNGQSAGYASQPGEVVNYVENHDNQTLFDINALRLPTGTSPEDRVRVQMLGAALNAFSQGVAYFHAGVDTLRSKSLDGNSFDSGDWFNRIDWSYRDNHFGTGAPPIRDNGASYTWIKPLLANPAIKPGPEQIALARDMFRDLLRIRASSTLFRLRSSEEIGARLAFHNTGPAQNPVLQAAHLDGAGYAGAGFRELLYLVNVDKVAQQLLLPTEKGKRYRLHPVQRSAGAADQRARTQAHFEPATGSFTVPPRTAVVWVLD